jgi:hypothetical protein
MLYVHDSMVYMILTEFWDCLNNMFKHVNSVPLFLFAFEHALG